MEFIVNVNVRENVDDICRVSSVLVAQLLHSPTAPRQLSGREGQNNAGRIIQPCEVIALVDEVIEGKAHLIRVRHWIPRCISCYEFRIPFCPAFFGPVGFYNAVILEIGYLVIECIAFILNRFHLIDDIIAAVFEVKYICCNLHLIINKRDTFYSSLNTLSGKGSFRFFW